VHTFAPLFEGTLEQTATPPLQPIGEALNCYYRDFLGSMNLEVPY